MPSTGTPVAAFSDDGELLAVYMNAGTDVCVWQRDSSKILSRLSNRMWLDVTCLAWSHNSSRRRRKKHAAVSSSACPLLAVAGRHGVTVFDVMRSEELNLLPCREQVSDACWVGNSILYLVNKTSDVTKWSFDTASVESWKADRHGVVCVGSSPDGKVVATAGRSIKLWDAESHSLLRKISGHSSSVNSLFFLSSQWLISAACDDRVINMWNCDSGYCAASLLCSDEPQHVNGWCEPMNDKLRITAICGDGVVQFFSPTVGSFPSSSPIDPSFTLHFINSQRSDLSPLPVLAAIPTANSISLAHSAPHRPILETMGFDQPETHVFLQRSPPGLVDATTTDGSTANDTEASVTLLGPGNMSLPSRHEQDSGPSLSERLKGLEVSCTSQQRKDTRSRPTAEGMVAMVTQAVLGGDKKLLEVVLQENRERVIQATVKKLPLTSVVPFLTKLIELLQASPSRAPHLVVWVRPLLSSHTGYLMTVPHILDSLSGLYQSMDARVAMLGKLCQLQGKLDLLLAQIISRENGIPANSELLNTPLLTLTAGDTLSDGEMGDIPSDEEWQDIVDEEEEEKGDDGEKERASAHTSESDHSDDMEPLFNF